MILLVSACNIPWWLLLLGMMVPAFLSWLLRGAFINEEKDFLKRKIFKLEAELKKCYEDKMRSTTTHVSPEVKFSDLPPSSYLKDESDQSISGGPKDIDEASSSSEDNKFSSFKKVQFDAKDKITESSQPSSESIYGTQSYSNDATASQLLESQDKHVKEVSKSNTSHTSQLSSTKYRKLTNNLQICEGIGPKMEEILKENGINSWIDLGGQTRFNLRTILNKYGDRFRDVNPKYWPAQANLASADEWNKLILLQEKIGRTTGSKKKLKVKKMLSKFGYAKKYKKNDLKAIEGIGPKIEDLLKKAGIKTWKSLSETKTKTLKNILVEAGEQYALVKPDSWPTQAKLAAAGDMMGLEQLQAKLKGGK